MISLACLDLQVLAKLCHSVLDITQALSVCQRWTGNFSGNERGTGDGIHGA